MADNPLAGLMAVPTLEVKNTVAVHLRKGAAQFQMITDAPRLEAELLLAHALQLSRSALHAHPERRLSNDQQAAYRALVNRRVAGEPLPYLIGRAEFYGLGFEINPHVLIPRPETETLVELALARIAGHSTPFIADVGTGSGCIAVALAVHTPQAQIIALDLSTDALDVARTNARRHGVDRRITFLQSDLLAALPGPVDLIVSNPPYVAAGEWAALPPQVREHEPRLALYGGSDGLDVVRRLLRQSAARLRLGGAVLIEIGATQGPAVLKIAREAFAGAEVTLHADLAGRDRVLHIQTPDTGEHDEPQ